jgi:hypothetical protein
VSNLIQTSSNLASINVLYSDLTESGKAVDFGGFVRLGAAKIAEVHLSRTAAKDQPGVQMNSLKRNLLALPS